MGRTALIIDDDKKAQSTIRSMFRRLGWEKPTLVRMGQEALAILKQNPGAFDVIILDQNLPVMKGIEFLIAAKALNCELPPVIMITGDYNSKVEPQAKQLGVASFFMKNKLSDNKLKEVLAEVLDREQPDEKTSQNPAG